MSLGTGRLWNHSLETGGLPLSCHRQQSPGVQYNETMSSGSFGSVRGRPRDTYNDPTQIQEFRSRHISQHGVT